MFRALGSRNYRLWASADLVSSTGTWMQVPDSTPALALHLSGLVSAVATVAVAAALVRTRRVARPVAEPEAMCERFDPVWVIPQPRGGPAIKLVPAPA
jgi:hypothetical protein